MHLFEWKVESWFKFQCYVHLVVPAKAKICSTLYRHNGPSKRNRVELTITGEHKISRKSKGNVRAQSPYLTTWSHFLVCPGHFMGPEGTPLPLFKTIRKSKCRNIFWQTKLANLLLGISLSVYYKRELYHPWLFLRIKKQRRFQQSKASQKFVVVDGFIVFPADDIPQGYHGLNFYWERIRRGGFLLAAMPLPRLLHMYVDFLRTGLFTLLTFFIR